MRIIGAMFGIYVMTAFTAYAETEKNATLCAEKGELCFHWWPKLSVPKGWHHEKEASLANDVNILVPDGFNFSNALTVIYAKANYKPREPAVKSIQQLINNDVKSFRKDVPEIDIKEVDPLPIANGEKLRSFTFFPSPKKPSGNIRNWERVTYGEENTEGNEFFLIFTMSSRTLAGYKAAEDVYKKILLGYKK